MTGVMSMILVTESSRVRGLTSSKVLASRTVSARMNCPIPIPHRPTEPLRLFAR